MTSTDRTNARRPSPRAGVHTETGPRKRQIAPRPVVVGGDGFHSPSTKASKQNAPAAAAQSVTGPLGWSTAKPSLTLSLEGLGSVEVDGLFLAELWAGAHPLSERVTSFLPPLAPDQLDPTRVNALRVALAERWFSTAAAKKVGKVLEQCATPAAAFPAEAKPRGESSSCAAELRSLFDSFLAKYRVDSGDDPASEVTSVFCGVLHLAWKRSGSEGFGTDEQAVLTSLIERLPPAKTERWLATSLRALKSEDGTLKEHLGATEGACLRPRPVAPTTVAVIEDRSALTPRVAAARALVEAVAANPNQRPDAVELAEAVRTTGLSAEDILQAVAQSGRPIGNVRSSLLETAHLVPYVTAIVRELFTNHPTHRLVFLGRDGELLHDAYRVLAALEGRSEDCRLFPGSGALFANFPGNTKFLQRFPALEAILGDSTLSSQLSFAMTGNARTFFRQFGVDEQLLADPRPLMLIDSGFMGSIGWFFREAVHDAFSLPIDDVWKKIEMKCVSADTQDAPTNSTLVEFEQPDNSMEQLFPRLFGSEISDFKGKQRLDQENFTFAVASALQLLPHAHGPFHFVCAQKGQLEALPDRPSDAVADSDQVREDVNAHVVSPFAALAVQVTFVEALCGTAR